MEIAIIFDDPMLVEMLHDLIEECPNYSRAECTITKFYSWTSFIASIQPNRFNLIYLDVEVNGIDSTKTAMEIREIDADALIIYIYNSNEYEWDIRKVHPFHSFQIPIKDKINFNKIFKYALEHV